MFGLYLVGSIRGEFEKSAWLDRFRKVGRHLGIGCYSPMKSVDDQMKKI
jgi:hypothetical protein